MAARKSRGAYLQMNSARVRISTSCPLQSTDSLWRRREVQCNIRRWLPHIGLHSERLHAAEHDCEETFEQLPSTDESELPSELKLQWQALPHHLATQPSHRADTTTSGVARDMVENPPINPIQGPSRSASVIRNELHAWQGELRARASAAGAAIPIFLSDYLLIQINSQIKLARVCGVAPGGATHDSDTADVVEYEHTPQAGVQGLFGTFKPVRNMNHDPSLKGSLAYVRHRVLPRSSIYVYDVQTFGTAQDLRIAETSLLRALAAICPNDAVLPARIPDTHATLRNKRRTANQKDVPSSSRQPAVKTGTRVTVHWTEVAIGWFNGRATCSRRDADGVTWITRVLYDEIDSYREHAQWHYMDPTYEDAVE